MAEAKKKEAPKEKQNWFQDFYQKMSKNEKALFYVSSVFFLLLLLDRIILGPIQNGIKVLDEETRQQILMIKNDLMIIGYKDVITEGYEAVKPYFAEERKTQEEELASFLKDMENLAGDSGIRLAALNPSGNIEEGMQYTKYEVKMECSGAINQVMTFMHALSSSIKPTKVENAELIPPKAGSDEMKCTMLISRMILKV